MALSLPSSDHTTLNLRHQSQAYNHLQTHEYPASSERQKWDLSKSNNSDGYDLVNSSSQLLLSTCVEFLPGGCFHHMIPCPRNDLSLVHEWSQLLSDDLYQQM